ncbi:Major facilitator superfamily transporter [Colletotrichum higginsianum IMI 349063]|uniref:Major facilitator superfamily transporter n=1 Tax=Colletotrichum higginsianum (strain IMI 349063) TaxID=759273 RepID=A0A1B7YWQ6_COLHI|nr:Major facilitator superfamily transporter [Colletotrichum higginsianum IMI 349063]OBR16461.1 Major facilitator superfamily transporter [Colletotrichum higginsianum IMI 349063]
MMNQSGDADTMTKQRDDDHPQEGLEDKNGQIVDMADGYTPEEEKEVLRKIDLAIMPMYLDKQSLSYASVFGLITDLNLTSTQYSWCSSIFYVGQLVSEYPFIYLMSRFHLTKFVGITVVIWGIICMCLAAPTNYAGFATVRFLLGFAEGAVSPAFITITSIWYRSNEHALRTALWITMNGVAQICGSLLMYGIAKNTALALAPWRTLFLVCGAVTSAAGVMFYLFMPNGPKDAWFLTARQKQVLSLRMAKDREGGDKTSFSVSQLKEAALDIKTWFVFWFGVLVTMQSPVLTFASLVINNIGYDKYETMLYTAPSGAVQIGMLWIGVCGCMLFPKNRTLVALVLILPPLAGNVLLMKLSTNSGWGMIAASWISSCITAVWSILLSLTASNVKGNTKRAIVNAMFFVGYCAGCIGAPQLWTEKPRYFNGVVTAIVTWCLLFVEIIVYRYLCSRDNSKRDADLSGAQSSGSGHDEVTLDAGGAPDSDMTDKQDRQFRYSI